MRLLKTCLILLLTGSGTQRAWAHGSYHDAVAAVDAELASARTDSELWHRRARLHLEHGEWTLALVDLERAERLAPARDDSDWLRGQALALAGQPAAALVALNAFLQQHPDHAGARLSRARLRLQHGQPQAALDDYRAALREEADAETVLEVATALVRQQQFTQAADLLAQHLERLGDVPFLLRMALDVELRLGRHEAALARVAALQRCAPRPEPWMARRAEIHDAAGHPREALAAWRALHDHLQRLPNLERGLPEVWPLLEASRHALTGRHRRSAAQPAGGDGGK